MQRGTQRADGCVERKRSRAPEVQSTVAYPRCADALDSLQNRNASSAGRSPGSSVLVVHLPILGSRIVVRRDPWIAPWDDPHRFTVAGAAPELGRNITAAHRLPVSPAARGTRDGHLLNGNANENLRAWPCPACSRGIASPARYGVTRSPHTSTHHKGKTMSRDIRFVHRRNASAVRGTISVSKLPPSARCRFTRWMRRSASTWICALRAEYSASCC
jgi:hypothetical protein